MTIFTIQDDPRTNESGRRLSNGKARMGVEWGGGLET